MLSLVLPCAARRALPSLAVAAAIGIATALLPAAPAAAKAGAPIRAAYFGVHHCGLDSDGPAGCPQTPVGSVRLWDNQVSWRHLEVAPGQFDWTRLDAQVAKARAAGASVLLVLGQTPRFHSSKPAAASAYGPGASAMPKSKAAWVRYVKAVAQRNKTVWGGIADFQVWNEANVRTYWSGTPKQMATLTAWTRAALRSVDRSATLVAPAMVTRLVSQRAWIKAFYGQRVGGRNVSAQVDALSFQLYPDAKGTPESSMTLLRAVRAILARYRVSKPIWNTEVNYGLVGGPGAGATARRIASVRQVGNVVRTYVLNAQNRVSRVYWYSWDLLGLSNTPLVETDRVTLTPAGQAFAATRSWLLGTRPAGCAVNRAGTYTCTFLSGREKRTVVWNPKKDVRVTIPKRTLSVASWDNPFVARSGQRVRVGVVPLMIRTRR